MRKIIYLLGLIMAPFNLYAFVCQATGNPSDYYYVELSKSYKRPENSVTFYGSLDDYPFRDEYLAEGFDECAERIVCMSGYYATGNPAIGTMVCNKCPTNVNCPEGTIGSDILPNCNAGQYLNDAGECEACNIGYYCPGDNMQYNCTEGTPLTTGLAEQKRYALPYYSDERGLSACKTCPTISDSGVLKPEYYYVYSAPEKTPESYIHDSIQQCYAQWNITQTNGSLTVACKYGTQASYTEPGKYSKCIVTATFSTCNKGYWVDTDRDFIESKNVQKSQNIAFNGYWYVINNEFCTPVRTGYWSDGTSLVRNKCPDGTSNHIDTATSADTCKSLCTAGATQLHAGTYSFNIWPNGQCSSPALNIGLSGGTCCINLERNAGAGLNINYNGTTYHTVN